MEFLDPKKQRAHLIRLFIGYALIGTALILTTIILLYQAYGFGIRNGQVIQNGLIFLSSTPNPADIYVNGQKRTEQTNTRLLIPAGQYTVSLQRQGYRNWKRAITVEGGTVVRFDYPMLIPNNLQTQDEKTYDLPPELATVSPDRHWLVVQANPTYTTFDIFDLSKPFKTPTDQPITLPATISTLQGTHAWKVVDWSNDNKHVLLQHIATNNGKQTSEYILVDRSDPTQSVNLTATLGSNPTQMQFRDKKYDKYFLYTDDHRLLTASLDQPKPQLLLDHVLAFKAYGADKVLYATDLNAPSGKSIIKLQDGQKSYTFREVTAGPAYMLELAQYQGDWYAVTGAPSENKTYVYKNPMDALNSHPDLPLVPVQVLKVANPTYVAFSANTRFIMAENGQQFGIYDVENEKGYAYAAPQPLDTNQPHAYWMDGSHISYVSNNKTVMFDFDSTNQQTLTTASSLYQPVFDQNYKMLYSFVQQNAKTADGKDTTRFVLVGTDLLAPADR